MDTDLKDLHTTAYVAFCQGLAFYLCVSALMMKR